MQRRSSPKPVIAVERRQCAVFGCYHAVAATPGLCFRHREWVARSQRNPRFFYYTPNWRKARRWFLAESPLCGTRADGRRHREHSICARERRIVVSTCIDHITAHCGDWWDFWDVENWQSLCRSCHSAKTYREDGALLWF